MTPALHVEVLERLGQAFAKLLAGTSREKRQALHQIEDLDLSADQIHLANELYLAAINARLLDDVTEAVGERRGIIGKAHAAARARRPILVRMSDVQREDVKWLWDRRIAQGKLSLLVGDPGVSKSTLTVDWVARVTRGMAFPYGGGVQSANAVMLTAEDGLADTVRGRLELAGADLDRVHIFTGVKNAPGSRIRFGRPSNA